VTRWELVVAAPATRALDRLSAGVASAIVEFMLGPLSDQPTIVGRPLQRELVGYWSARRGAYRVIYRIDERGHRVVVVRIDHRSDVYRRR
jgi:mRNA-degrading endonuclease RelE of RelBE toxin-antitoxin system